MREYTAVKAIIQKDHRILLVRESGAYLDGDNVGKFDFVGGRLESGEGCLAGLEREVREEIGCQVQIGEPFHVAQWFPQIQGEQVCITGVYFLCTLADDAVITLSDDHCEYIWMDPSDYAQYPLNTGSMQICKDKLCN